MVVVFIKIEGHNFINIGVCFHPLLDLMQDLIYFHSISIIVAGPESSRDCRGGLFICNPTEVNVKPADPKLQLCSVAQVLIPVVTVVGRKTIGKHEVSRARIVCSRPCHLVVVESTEVAPTHEMKPCRVVHLSLVAESCGTKRQAQMLHGQPAHALPKLPLVIEVTAQAAPQLLPPPPRIVAACVCHARSFYYCRLHVRLSSKQCSQWLRKNPNVHAPQ